MKENKKEDFKPLVIKDVIASKSKTLAKFLPGFVYRYLNRIMHIDYMNEILKRYQGITGVEFINVIIKDFNIKEAYRGLEHIPDEGRFIFASNHPLGGFDSFLLMKTVDAKLGKFKTLTNDVLMAIPQLRELFIPVNKHGGHSREVAKAMDDLYKSEEQVLIFPSGLASRKVKGKIVDLEWKKHFITKAIKYKRDVIPVHISGRNTERFYRLANIRKKLRIKWNLEMFFLPDETYRHRNTSITVTFGKPISYKTFDKSKTHKEWAKWVKDKVYDMV